MANYSRTDRVSEEIKRELAAVIRELKDPRLPQMTSVVAVKTTKDLKYAKVHISVMGDDNVKKEAFEALKSAGGYIRKEISRRLNLRQTPEFKFIEDDSIEYGAHIEKLLKDL
ncbi:MAG TPA: 30S ribosome-binding factor RbfA [Candidatus Monoglobus merdigallinarum]|uniref:Ribosome-binding factor A n=1 Tax=Candidatus Monoglobus merdigallinarum TaxID=2838698 RepID=A0A9D1PQM3_9FIRM|nr:30S ribosome-binding factor RbfA [Candidatus Monoglobus merdigallinarum]